MSEQQKDELFNNMAIAGVSSALLYDCNRIIGIVPIGHCSHVRGCCIGS
jgi:hypothetical protein